MSDTDFMLDLATIEDPNAPLAPGRYKAKLADWSGEPSKKGFAMLTFMWVTEGGRELRQWCVLSHDNAYAQQKGRFAAKETLVALGADASKPVKATDFLATAIGREVILEVSQEPDRRTPATRVNPDTFEEEKVDPSEIKMTNSVARVLPVT